MSWVDNYHFIEEADTETVQIDNDSVNQDFLNNFKNIRWFDVNDWSYSIQPWDNLSRIFSRFFEDMWINWDDFARSVVAQDNWINNVNTIHIWNRIDMISLFDELVQTDRELISIRQEELDVINNSLEEQSSLIMDIRLDIMSDIKWFNQETWIYTIQPWDNLYRIYSSFFPSNEISSSEFINMVISQNNWIRNASSISIWQEINMFDILEKSNLITTNNQNILNNNSNLDLNVSDWSLSNADKNEHIDANMFDNVDNSKDVISLIRDWYDKFDFNIVSEKDIMSLVYFESMFDVNARSSTWSVGLFQTTTIAVRDMMPWYRPHLYNQEVISEMLNRNWFDNLRQMLPASVRMDPLNSRDLWMLYLDWIENRVSWLRRSEINSLQNNKDNFYDRVWSFLSAKNIDINRQNFDTIFTEVINNPDIQAKFNVFKEYNSDSNKYRWEAMSHMYYYAFTVLYISKFS